MAENKHEHDNFFDSAFAIKGSVTPKVIKKVMALFVYASVIAVINHFFRYVALPIAPFEYGGFIMGLILVFRVNAGHDRWWEARKLWGNVVNHSRNLAMIVKEYIAPRAGEISMQNLWGYIIAFPWLMKDDLRGFLDRNRLQEQLDVAVYACVIDSASPVLKVSDLIARELHNYRTQDMVDGYTFLRAEETRALLVDALGGCQRIVKTPMPFVMAVKARRFILFFLLMLPLGLVDVTNLFITPVISAFVAYALLSLDQIGVELQNPFALENLSHLPLNKICEGITRDIRFIHSNEED